MNHYIYEITNNVNGMKYIGKRSCECDIDKDSYMGGGTKLKEAKIEFGIENFSKKILAIADDEAMALDLEYYYIDKRNAVESPMYYNQVYGGNISHMYKHKDLNKQSKVRKIISEKNKGTNAGENSKVAKKIICLTTGQVFISGAEASKYANLNRSSVSKACRPGSINRFAGRHPETGERLEWMYYEEYEAIQRGETFEYNPKSTPHRKSNSKKVICLNNLKIFDSVVEASEYYNIKYPTYISHCCTSKIQFAGKDSVTGDDLRWMYYDDYLKLSSDNK